MAKKPPLNMGCEAAVSIGSSSPSDLHVNYCRKPGRERPDIQVLNWATILCDECYAAIKAKREEKQNDPKGQTGSGPGSTTVR